MSEPDRLRVLCFGNPLHGDDGFGPAVALALGRMTWPAGVAVFECGTRGLDTLPLFADCASVLLIDAMAGDTPGRVHVLRPADVPMEHSHIGHGSGLGDLLAMLPEALDPLPEITILAVEIERCTAFSLGLSLEVAAAIPEVVEIVKKRALTASTPPAVNPTNQGDSTARAELFEELEILRQANLALENELSHSAEALELLIAEQEKQTDELHLRSHSLSQLNATMERAISTMAEIFVLLGPDGRVLRVNRLFEKELGYPASQVIGHFLEDFLPADERSALAARLGGDRAPLLLNAIRAASGQFEMELAFERAESPGMLATALPYLVRASLMHSQAGKLEGAVVVSTNILALKSRENALRNNERQLQETAAELRNHRDNLASLVDVQTRDLRQAKEAAEAASQAKSDFLSNISHEVRTPLNAILGMSELCLLAEGQPQQQQRYLDKIRQAANHLLGIINDVLDFSKIEAGKLSMEALPFDMALLLDEVTQLLIARIEEKGLQLSVDLEASANQRFIGDPLRLKQILINLLGNAIKFSEQGNVSIRVAREGCTTGSARLHFVVSDEGIGIPHDQQARIFSAFNQGDNSTTRRYGGSGLGLSISRRLVENMQGQIWVESTPGLGSHFHFTIELACAPDASPRNAAAKRLQGVVTSQVGLTTAHVSSAPIRQLDFSAVRHLQGADILVVDDVDLNRELMEDLLSSAGLNVRLAEDGCAAIAAIRERRPDAVLMDCQMPVMDGFAATRHLRGLADYADLPIIALTAGALEHDRERCLAAGMNAFVTKPVDLEGLLRVISELLPERHMPDPAPQSSAASPAITTNSSADFPGLPALPGINVEAGLAIARNKVDFYRRLLTKFRQSYCTNFMPEFQTALASQQVPDAIRLAHTLKGVSHNLGIEALGNMAADAESALKHAGEENMIPTTLAAIAGELKRLDELLATLE